MTVRATVNSQPVSDLRVQPSTAGPSVRAPGLTGMRRPAPATQVGAEQPLAVERISKVVTSGEVLELGGGDYLLELEGGTGIERLQVVDGRADTGWLSPGLRTVTAVRGSDRMPVGRLYVR